MEKTTDIFKALAHRTRLNILSLLLDGEICVCKIMEVLDLPQSTASRHLAILKNAGLVVDRREGTWSHYSLSRGQSPLADSLLAVLKVHLPATFEGAGNVRRLAEALRRERCA